MKMYAEIVDGRIANVILWDGKTEFNPGMELVEIPEGSPAGIGWDYLNQKFVDNRPEPETTDIP
jgi:hypothetical protein